MCATIMSYCRWNTHNRYLLRKQEKLTCDKQNIGHWKRRDASINTSERKKIHAVITEALFAHMEWPPHHVPIFFSAISSSILQIETIINSIWEIKQRNLSGFFKVVQLHEGSVAMENGSSVVKESVYLPVCNKSP